MRLTYNNYNTTQNQPSFGAIMGPKFAKGLEELLAARFGAEKAGDLMAVPYSMEFFESCFAGIKVGIAHSEAETLKWLDPIIDIERKDKDTFSISAKLLPNSTDIKNVEIRPSGLDEDFDCLDQILEKIKMPVNKLHQTNGHIINPFDDASDLVSVHQLKETSFDYTPNLTPSNQLGENPFVCDISPALQVRLQANGDHPTVPIGLREAC